MVHENSLLCFANLPYATKKLYPILGPSIISNNVFTVATIFSRPWSPFRLKTCKILYNQSHSLNKYATDYN